MTEDEWITDYIFSKQKTGVRLRDLVNKSKMWGFNPKYIAKYIKDMLRAERLIKIKGKLFPSQDEYERGLQKVMYAKKLNRKKVARELIQIAKELTSDF
jgi:hypothetical protein